MCLKRKYRSRKQDAISDAIILWYVIQNEVKYNNRTFTVTITLTKFRKLQMVTSIFFSSQNYLHGKKKHKWHWYNMAYYVIHPKHLNMYIYILKNIYHHVSRK